MSAQVPDLADFGDSLTGRERIPGRALLAEQGAPRSAAGLPQCYGELGHDPKCPRQVEGGVIGIAQLRQSEHHVLQLRKSVSIGRLNL